MCDTCVLTVVSPTNKRSATSALDKPSAEILPENDSVFVLTDEAQPAARKTSTP